jgi:hypothetical protein
VKGKREREAIHHLDVLPPRAAWSGTGGGGAKVKEGKRNRGARVNEGIRGETQTGKAPTRAVRTQHEKSTVVHRGMAVGGGGRRLSARANRENGGGKGKAEDKNACPTPPVASRSSSFKILIPSTSGPNARQIGNAFRK